MPSKTEPKWAGEGVVSEANGYRSRDAITVLSGENLGAMRVIGRTLTGGAGAATADAGNTGNGAMGAITVTGLARVGTYRLVFVEPGTNVGTFELFDPDGVAVGKGNVAAAFSAGGLAFTLADGATDFVAGDGFSIVVTGTYKWKGVTSAATDGSQYAAGILFAAVDATSADAPGVALVRSAEFNHSEVDYGALNAGQITAARLQLSALGLIVRDAV